MLTGEGNKNIFAGKEEEGSCKCSDERNAIILKTTLPSSKFKKLSEQQ